MDSERAYDRTVWIYLGAILAIVVVVVGGGLIRLNMLASPPDDAGDTGSTEDAGDPGEFGGGFSPICEENYAFIIGEDGMTTPTTIPAGEVPLCIRNDTVEDAVFGFDGPTMSDTFNLNVVAGNEMFLVITMKQGDHTFFYQLDSMFQPTETLVPVE